MAEPSQAVEPLTVSKDGKAPQNVITTAQAAFGVYQEARDMAMLDDLRFAAIRGQYDGMPPYNPKDLEREGLKDAPNINRREMTAKVNTYVSTWIDHDCSSERMVDIVLDRYKFETEFAWKRANELVSGCFSDLIKLWDDDDEQETQQFIFEKTICNLQMGLFGIGVMHFQDERDWRPCAIPTRKVMPNRGMKIMLTNGNAVFIEKPYTVSQLWNYVKDAETARRTKWNRDAVIKVLYQKTNTNRQGVVQFQSVAEWENMMRNNDYLVRYNFSPVYLVECYFKEYEDKDGKWISHYVVGKEGQASNEFLYENQHQFAKWTNIIVPFCDTTGPEGDWHGVKGFGDLIFDGCDFNNLFFNATALAAMMAMFPMWKAGSESDREKWKQIVLTRMGIISPDIDIEQARVAVDLQSPLLIQQDNTRVINSNSRIFPINENNPRGGEKTATQATFDRQDQATFTSLQIKFYRVTGADRLFSEMYRRMSASASDYPVSWPGGKTAKKFREKVKQYGLTMEQVQKPKSVVASRSGGTGNMGLDNFRADELLKIATPGPGQMAARMRKAATLTSYEEATSYVQPPPPEMPEDVTIGLENGLFSNGQFTNAFGFQDHERHLGQPEPQAQGHLGVMISAVQVATQIDEIGLEQDLEGAMKIQRVMESTLAHCIEHVQFMAQLEINEAIVKGLNKAMNDFQQFTQNFAKSIERALQKQQEQQPQQDPEMAKAQAEIARDDMKAQAEIQRKNAAVLAKLQGQKALEASRHGIKEADAAMKRGMDAESFLIEQQRKQIETVDNIAANALKTQADIAMTRAKGNAKKVESSK